MLKEPYVRAGSSSPRIVVDGLTKRYGQATVVDGLSFAVEPNRVTGFLGPNGAGKTQTIKMILGLVRPSDGQAMIDGLPLHGHGAPQRVVGSVLDGGAFHPGRTARNALRIHAGLAGVPLARADELLERVGLTADCDRRVGKFSLGMRQRLALAQGLLVEPSVLIADEAANGLDPAGVTWMRGLLRDLAEQGTTVLLSSHLLSEAERLVDDVIVIARGRLVSQGTLADLHQTGARHVRVTAVDSAALVSLLRARGLTVTTDGADEVQVSDTDVATVGQIAAEANIALSELAQAQETLEDRYLQLTEPDGQAQR